MKHRNYAIMVEENSHYPVSYTIKQDGTKVIENTMLKGGDMTENQIKELFFLGYFEEKPTQEEDNEIFGFVMPKTVTSWKFYFDVLTTEFGAINLAGRKLIKDWKNIM